MVWGYMSEVDNTLRSTYSTGGFGGTSCSNLDDIRSRTTGRPNLQELTLQLDELLTVLEGT